MSKPTDERYTPPDVVRVVSGFARIDLDPCTTWKNPTGARRVYTKDESGLTGAWSGFTYVNPPYSRGQLAIWVARCIEAAESGVEIIMLGPADLSTGWSKQLFASAQCLAFWGKRIAFIKPSGEYESGAKQPSAFWYFGERQGRFRRHFEPHASVVFLR